jgi:hypothetical protein
MSIFIPGCSLVIVYTFCVLLLYGNNRQCSSSLDVLCKFSFLEDLELTCKAKRLYWILQLPGDPRVAAG